MKKYDLLSISPVDGRYFEICHDLAKIFSEYSLIKKRILVEVKWLMFLSEMKGIKGLPKLNATSKKFLLNIYNNFSLKDAEKVKKIELTTKHDVKAVEYYIKDKLKSHSSFKKHVEYVHICCTSEDINNLAYSLMIKKGRSYQLWEAQIHHDNKLCAVSKVRLSRIK